MEGFSPIDIVFQNGELNCGDSLHLFILSTESGVTYLVCKFGNRLDMFDSATPFPPLTVGKSLPTGTRRSPLLLILSLTWAGPHVCRSWGLVLPSCTVSLPNAAVQFIIGSGCELYAPA